MPLYINIVNVEAISWLKQQPDATFDLIISDPPYNLGKNYGNTLDNLTK